MTRDIKPMPAEEIEALRVSVEKRWNDKPWYFGEGMSPGCMLRAHEVLALIAAVNSKSEAKGTTEMTDECIDSRTGRPCGDHGTAMQAIDFSLDHISVERDTFLKCWREGDLDEWPEFYEWLARRKSE